MLTLYMTWGRFDCHIFATYLGMFKIAGADCRNPIIILRYYHEVVSNKLRMAHDVSLSSPGATWTTNLKGEAQKYSFSFQPGISMACPSNKSSISVTSNASYTLDSWNTAEETISLNKSFTCTPTSVN